jgi:hypothetical protein
MEFLNSHHIIQHTLSKIHMIVYSGKFLTDCSRCTSCTTLYCSVQLFPTKYLHLLLVIFEPLIIDLGFIIDLQFIFKLSFNDGVDMSDFY